MAKTENRAGNDDLVVQAKVDAEVLGQLYDLYYGRIFKFCVHRLFHKEIAEDVTSDIFLAVARKVRNFKGQTEADFRNWLYAIAANHTNAYIRKASRRKELMAEAAARMNTKAAGDNKVDNLDWPTVYQAILKLKPQHQTIVTLRFFENLEFEQIAEIINVKPATIRVTLHRILNKLRDNLHKVADGGK